MCLLPTTNATESNEKKDDGIGSDHPRGCSNPLTHSHSQDHPPRRVRGQPPLNSSLSNSYSARSSFDSAESQLLVPVQSNCMIGTHIINALLGGSLSMWVHKQWVPMNIMPHPDRDNLFLMLT